MRLSSDRIQSLAGTRGLSVSGLLKKAAVSRNAYYSLLRRESLLPKSVHRLADALGVSRAAIIEMEPQNREAVDRLVAEARRIADRSPAIDFENVWHTLLVLREPPIERLRRSLRRGRAAPVWRG